MTKYYRLKKRLLNIEAGSVFSEEEVPNILLHGSTEKDTKDGSSFVWFSPDENEFWEEITVDECLNECKKREEDIRLSEHDFLRERITTDKEGNVIFTGLLKEGITWKEIGETIEVPTGLPKGIKMEKVGEVRYMCSKCKETFPEVKEPQEEKEDNLDSILEKEDIKGL